MSLNDLLNQHLDGGMTPEDAARAALAEIPPRELREMLFPPTKDRAWNLSRGRTRKIEHAVLTSVGAGASFPDAARQLMEEGFALPDGRRVLWPDATADEHLLRANWQRRQAKDCLQDAMLHEQAAAEITSAGVSCLRDIQEAA